MRKMTGCCSMMMTITVATMGHAAQLDKARVPENVLKRFDTNKNGVLDPEERTKARAAAMRRRSNEPPGARPASGRALLKRFDRNGDGKLNEQERRVMRRELAKRAVGNSNRRRKGRDRNPPQPVELPARVTRVDLTRLMSTFDADSDGKLTGRERTEAFRQYRASQSR